MAIASFYRRAAVAASQVVAGFDEEGFRQILETSPVGLAIGEEASGSEEGRTAADLAIRLMARLYPTLDLRIVDGSLSEELEGLARSINPDIEFIDSAQVGLVIGTQSAAFEESLYIGADEWIARFSCTTPQAVGKSANPFGAGVAACFGAANLFRRLFLPSADIDDDVTFDVLTGSQVAADDAASNGRSWKLHSSCTVVGLGAIGNGAIWALSRCAEDAKIALVDHEVVDLSNLQRYVLAENDDVGRNKTEVAQRYFRDGVATEHPIPWDFHVQATGYRTHRALVALDSARDRRSVQASLPEWVFNA